MVVGEMPAFVPVANHLFTFIVVVGSPDWSPVPLKDLFRSPADDPHTDNCRQGLGH